MKELLLLRHAKSSWKDLGMPDHDRPLKKRGLRDAPEVGRKLRELGLAPDRILSSTAARAHATARLAAEACRFDGTIELVPALYLGGPLAYLDALRDLPADVGRAGRALTESPIRATLRAFSPIALRAWASSSLGT